MMDSYRMLIMALCLAVSLGTVGTGKGTDFESVKSFLSFLFLGGFWTTWYDGAPVNALDATYTISEYF